MKGVQFWAHSFCRSTLALYDELGKRFGVPYRICLGRSGLGLREEIGFDPDEFARLELVELDGSSEVALNALDERKEWHQFFGTYQDVPHVQAALAQAIKEECIVGIGSEAPCNLFEPGGKRIAKALYTPTLARQRVAHVVKYADFILNWSGDGAEPLRQLGWDSDKIIPFGYFPPPLQGSTFTPRDEKHHKDFHILCSGNMTWHRGQDVLMDALVLLKRWGVPVRATFTSKGPLAEGLQAIAKKHDLACDFPGFVSMPELIELYQSCSVFAALGRAEPWGMRVNDALLCGAPLLISTGMGAVKLANDYGYGLSFRSDDAYDLAWRIRELAADGTMYRRINQNLAENHTAILPEEAADRAVSTLLTHCPNWQPAGSR
ncbi:glycosyltransferase [Erythrobacter sp. SCSIO 43205]|uniref:glycosyltransferase family 4 protein n=1 Tax=Erythrobacter sp. SCSIO 43205 TaxID=2779361 RepID=UPI001CA9EF2B|nr:glycosyltransferase [Erythrobacter sp. SCSIO 43205]UAB78973.1 glycosyltransferase [Erythrobacter sp. SCSIO 43205]